MSTEDAETAEKNTKLLKMLNAPANVIPWIPDQVRDDVKSAFVHSRAHWNQA